MKFLMAFIIKGEIIYYGNKRYRFEAIVENLTGEKFKKKIKYILH
jgi:hypothetical protein